MGETAQDQWAERRRAPRIVLKTEVSFSSESNFYTGFADNISEGGIFIATYHPAELGTQMEIEFSLPDSNEPIKVQAEVRWAREQDAGEDASPGLGLRFLDLDENDRQRIDTFAKRRGTLFFDDE